MLEDLVFGERVALDGRRREDALGEEQLIEVLVQGRLERDARQVLALGDGLPKKEPQVRGGTTQIQPEGEPGVALLVFAHSECPLL